MACERSTQKTQRSRKRNILALFCQICIVVQLLVFLGSCDQKPGEKDVSLKKELEIGLLEGDEDYIFGLIADVRVDSLGNIFILDAKMNRVVKYDRDGKIHFAIWGKGRGTW